MTVNPIMPVSVSIAANPAEEVCAGSTVIYTATRVNGGANPGYQWKVNGTVVSVNSNTYSYVPGNNDNVSCVLTSDILCSTGNPATSNSILMTVHPLLPVSIAISVNPNDSVCAGTNVNFSA